MKPSFTVACIFLKSVWQAVSLRSALAALLLAPLAATSSHAAESERPATHFSTFGQATLHESPLLNRIKLAKQLVIDGFLHVQRERIFEVFSVHRGRLHQQASIAHLGGIRRHSRRRQLRIA